MLLQYDGLNIFLDGVYRMGKARKRFLARPGNGREPASCGGGRENSDVLQATYRYLVLAISVLRDRWEGKRKRSERAAWRGSRFGRSEEELTATCFAPRSPKTSLYREFLTLDNPKV